MSDNKSNNLRDWLGFASAEKAMEKRRMGRIIGGAIGVIAALVLAGTLALLVMSLAALFTGEGGEVNVAIRNFGLILAAVFTAGFAAWRGAILTKQADIAQHGHIADRYIKAVERLGTEKTQKAEGKETTVPNIEVRIGALYTLERIAKESMDDHILIMETICAYIRNNAGIHNKGYDRGDIKATDETRLRLKEQGEQTDEEIRQTFVYLKPREDIQTALNILARRRPDQIAHERARKRGEEDEPYALDLRETMLASADLTRANFAHVQLERANLTTAKLQGANLTKAGLDGANLTKAELDGAKLTKAGLNHANLTSACLFGANLSEAGLVGANLAYSTLSTAYLKGARLHYANLIEAGLADANLTGAGLDKANLTRAKLNGANVQSTNLTECVFAAASVGSVDFRGSKNLTQMQINASFGEQAGHGVMLLPDGLTYPDHWYRTEDASEDADGVWSPYDLAYDNWLETLPKS